MRPFFLAVCRGAILGPGRFVDSLGTSWGLRLIAPSEDLRFGREAAWVFLVFSFLLFLFSRSVVFAATLFTRPE